MLCRLVLLLSLGLCLVSPGIYGANSNKAPKHSDKFNLTRPNFVFIMTDDQDLHLDSLAYMPKLKQLVGDEGTVFERHYCTIAVCCPSRVSLMTGKLAHNTNVTDVNPPYGGYPKFVAEGHNQNYLPVWLQDAGYNTFYTGKFLNAHSTSNYNKPYPRGWNGTAFLLDPSTYSYWNSTFQHNYADPVVSNGYSTDLISQNALGFIEEAYGSDRPFFIGITPIAPHAKTAEVEGSSIPAFTDPVPAPRHSERFRNAKVPRGANFNPDTPSGASWVLDLPRLNSSDVEYMDEYYRRRLQSLQAVDDLVENVVKKLEDNGLLENTYIFYTSDNGYHVGQHRMVPGKGCPYEEDINVPMIVRGPGVPKGRTVDLVTSHTDIAATLFDLAGIPLREDFDGIPMPLSMSEMRIAKSDSRREHVSVEYWGSNLQEGDIGRVSPTGPGLVFYNNTYKAMRVIGYSYNLYYAVWCTNEHELYDLANDPYQMRNLISDTKGHMHMQGRDITQVIARLDALLLVLKSCKGSQCTLPWESLHPDKKVTSLDEALNPRYDAFYAMQPSISFSACELGYFPGSEGPQQGYSYRRDGDWGLWA